jgi:hypothetical protein
LLMGSNIFFIVGGFFSFGGCTGWKTVLRRFSRLCFRG